MTVSLGWRPTWPPAIALVRVTHRTFGANSLVRSSVVLYIKKRKVENKKWTAFQWGPIFRYSIVQILIREESYEVNFYQYQVLRRKQLEDARKARIMASNVILPRTPPPGLRRKGLYDRKSFYQVNEQC